MCTFSETGRVELLKGFIAAQSEMENAKKSTKNDHFKSKYADLSSVCDAVMEALGKHGIGVIQLPTFDDDGVHVETLLVHEAGGSMSHTLSLKPAQNTPQGVGSTITYARRYSLMSICGVAPEDDDGNAASGITGAQKTAQRQTTQAQPSAASQKGEYDEWQTGIRSQKTLDDLNAFAKANSTKVNNWRRDWQDIAREEYAKCRNTLVAADAEVQQERAAADPDTFDAEQVGDENPFHEVA